MLQLVTATPVNGNPGSCTPHGGGGQRSACYGLALGKNTG